MNAAIRTSFVRVLISPTVALDHERRNVFPELRPEGGKPFNSGRAGHVYEIDRSTFDALLLDSAEQSAIERGQSGRGLTTAYRALFERATRECGFKWIGWYQYRLLFSHFTPSTAENVAVAELFERLSIPHAVTGGAQ